MRVMANEFDEVAYATATFIGVIPRIGPSTRQQYQVKLKSLLIVMIGPVHNVGVGRARGCFVNGGWNPALLAHSNGEFRILTSPYRVAQGVANREGWASRWERSSLARPIKLCESHAV